MKMKVQNLKMKINIDLNKNNFYNNYSLEDLNNLTLKELQDVARNNKIKVKGREVQESCHYII